MKPTLTLPITLALTLAAPLFAQETQPAPAAETQPAQTATAAPAPAPAPADSPLVAAARRANRKGRKPSSRVITNATVKQSNGTAHVTTAAAQKPLPPLPQTPRATPDMLASQHREAQKKSEAEKLAEQKKLDEEKQRRIEARAAAAEEGLYDEGAASEDPQPATPNDQKPPQR
ncbi:MAG TPA: hypothetical protein VF824_01520 [Thermoanaerobaculia bacterium]|jgi:hypothetical protein